MKKVELFELARSLASAYQIDESDMSLSHSSALYIHRIRRSPNHADISLTPNGWKRAVLCHNPSPDATEMEILLFPTLIVLHPETPGYTSSLIDGFQVQTLQSLKALAQSKDSLLHRHLAALELKTKA